MANRPLRMKVELQKVYPDFISIEDLDLTPYVDNIEVFNGRGEATTVILKLVNVEINAFRLGAVDKPTIVHNVSNVSNVIATGVLETALKRISDLGAITGDACRYCREMTDVAHEALTGKKLHDK